MENNNSDELRKNVMIDNTGLKRHYFMFFALKLLKLIHNYLGKLSNDLNPPLGKNMAAVHFTTIPCEPNTAY